MRNMHLDLRADKLAELTVVYLRFTIRVQANQVENKAYFCLLPLRISTSSACPQLTLDCRMGDHLVLHSRFVAFGFDEQCDGHVASKNMWAGVRERRDWNSAQPTLM
jgi:hypothetical protein